MTCEHQWRCSSYTFHRSEIKIIIDFWRYVFKKYDYQKYAVTIFSDKWKMIKIRENVFRTTTKEFELSNMYAILLTHKIIFLQ